MQPGEDPFQFMMEIYQLAADLDRLGGRSVSELRKCVIIVAGLSTDNEIKVRMIENNPACLDRPNIERTVGNQCKRLLRQQHNSNALSASGSTTTADRGEKRRRQRNRVKGNCFNCGRKGPYAEDCRSTKMEMEKSGDAPADKKGGGRGKCYVWESEEHFTHKHRGLCRRLEHQSCDCEEQGPLKGVMLAKSNMPTNAEVRLIAAMTGAARGDGKEE